MQGQLNARQQQIHDQIARNGEVKLAELKNNFDVTEMTLRRDLEKLEQLGFIRRTFGGAILIGNDIALQDRTGVMLEEKRRIGLKAAGLVQPGESIFIDGGTTTLQVARALPSDMDLKLVTNAINIASELQAKSIATIVTGGNLVERTSTLIGPMAAVALSRMAFHRVFIGCTGLTVSHGFSNSNLYESEIKQLAIAHSKEVNIVMDHSKLGLTDLCSFAKFTEVNRLITDQEIRDNEIRQALEQSEVEILS